MGNNSLEVIHHGGGELPTMHQEKSIVQTSHEKQKKREFLLSTKSLYLTYSNCNLSLSDALDQLKDILSFYNVIDFVLVREYLENDQPHLHAYLKMAKKCNITSSNFLDLKNVDGEIYHGIYRSARKRYSVIRYILKSIKSKKDINLYYSSNLSELIDDLANYETSLKEQNLSEIFSELPSLLEQLYPGIKTKIALKKIEPEVNNRIGTEACFALLYAEFE